MMKPSMLAKLAVANLAALVCAYTAHQGSLKLAALLGTATGKHLAPILNPLLNSPSTKRQTLGLAMNQDKGGDAVDALQLGKWWIGRNKHLLRVELTA